ncbi:MAG: hypothetical protein IPM79_37595 [Polyangiaceae bacterium]|jgi:hypothetical protein|nr:hypothetical protein [Polyangiaceae bacterium]MBK8943163.1 hypothetical protein [Polyangiaceae bacterium]
MSIFRRDSGFDPSDWLKEKTLLALMDAVRIVDLANEPDTTRWYEKQLRRIAEPLIARLVPVVALVHRAGEDAVTHDAWRPILKGGTFALAAWAKKHDIVDPAVAGFKALAPEREDEEVMEKAVQLPQGLISVEEDGALELKSDIAFRFAVQMGRGEFNPQELRLLAWLLQDLRLSEFADVVVVSKRFLPTDIGSSVDETVAAYRSLCERGAIERVENVPAIRAEALALRLVIERNASRHAAPYREESFGFPGARVGGQPTIGNELTIVLPPSLAAVVRSWSIPDAALGELRDHLQAALGEDRAFVETVHLREGELHVGLRYPMETKDAVMVAELATASESWLRRRTVT